MASADGISSRFMPSSNASSCLVDGGAVVVPQSKFRALLELEILCLSTSNAFHGADKDETPPPRVPILTFSCMVLPSHVNGRFLRAGCLPKCVYRF
jgi:hypothetical protein